MSHKPRPASRVIALINLVDKRLANSEPTIETPEYTIRYDIKYLGRLFIELSRILNTHYKEGNYFEGVDITKHEQEDADICLLLKRTLAKNIEWLFILIGISIQKRIRNKRIDNTKPLSKRSIKLHKQMTKRLNSLAQLQEIYGQTLKRIAVHKPPESYQPITAYDQKKHQKIIKNAQKNCQEKGNSDLEMEIEETKKIFQYAEITLWTVAAISTAGSLATTICLTVAGSTAKGIFSLAGFTSHTDIVFKILLPLFLVAVSSFMLAPIVRRERQKDARKCFSFLANNTEVVNTLKTNLLDSFNSDSDCCDSSDSDDEQRPQN